MTPLRVGVVGLGVGEQHADGFRRDGRCRLVAVCDRSADRRAAAARRFEGARVVEDAEALITASDIDAVAIASFDDAHFEHALAGLRAGKHVFVEKPMCRTEPELEGLRAAWRGSGLRMRSNLVLRAAPLYGWLRERIAAGDLGRVYAFDGDYLYGRLEKITEGWRGDVRDYSVLLGGGIHLVDLMLWLTGERPEAVAAEGSRLATEGTKFAYDDYAAATFRFPSGMIGRITANFGCVHRHQHVLRVFGTMATFIFDDRGARLHRSRDPATPAEEIALSPLPATKADLIPGFVDCVLDGGDVGGEDHEFAVVAACVAADRARTSRTTMEMRQ